jgi:hypothetical protein
MNAKMVAAVSAISALVLAGPAPAEDRGTPEQERDCMQDAMTYCGEHIFAPDRNAKIGLCLWQHRTQISRACFAHLRPPKR